jgi:hypothetical protein
LTPAAATDATLVPDLASPQPTGTPEVVFTAGATGGSGSYEYRFWLYSASGGVWTIVQDYSTTNTWTWDTSALPADNYIVYLWARSVGSTAGLEAETGVNYVIQ